MSVDLSPAHLIAHVNAPGFVTSALETERSWIV